MIVIAIVIVIVIANVNKTVIIIVKVTCQFACLTHGSAIGNLRPKVTRWHQ